MGSPETRKFLLLQGPLYYDSRRPVTGRLVGPIEAVYPLGIRIVSALIKQAASEANTSVEISLETMTPGKIDKLEPLIAAADAVFCSARFFDACLAQKVIELGSKNRIPVVAGGYGPTFNEELFREAVRVRGEFEPVANQFMEDLFGGRLEQEYNSFTEPPWDYNNYIRPDRSFPTHQLFEKLTHRRRETQTWMAGCDNFCTYCSAVRMQRGGGEKGVRYRRAEDIIAETESMGLNQGDILFLTDNNTALIPRDVLVPVLTFLKKRGIYIVTEATLAPLLADHEEYGDESLLSLMSTKDGHGGCLGLAYGADDLLRERVAGSTNKDLTTLEKGAPILREYGIPLHLMIVLGLDHHPYPETFFQVARVSEEVGAPVDFYFIATPYKTGGHGGWGDKVYREERVELKKKTTDFTHCQVVFEPQGMSRVELQQGFYWLLRQRYNLRRIGEICQRNFDARIAATNPFLANFLIGLAWGAFKYVGLQEIKARGYLDPKIQGFLDEEYRQWKIENA